MMFGDVGGLNDFLSLLLAAIFGFFSESILQAKIISTLFFTAKSNSNQVRSSKVQNKEN